MPCSPSRLPSGVGTGGILKSRLGGGWDSPGGGLRCGNVSKSEGLSEKSDSSGSMPSGGGLKYKLSGVVVGCLRKWGLVLWYGGGGGGGGGAVEVPRVQ